MATFFIAPDPDPLFQVGPWDVPFFCDIGFANTQQAAPPFRVLFVTPIGSNTLRVFLSSEPRHFSPLSLDDSLLRNNWVVSVLSGPGLAPVIERVENAQAQPTEIPGIPFAWSVDLRTDTRVLTNTIYLTVGNPALVSAAGAALAAPPDDRDDHPGIAEARPRRPARPPQVADRRLDIAYDFFDGIFRLDSKSDLALHGGVEALKKRIIRRLISVLGGFFHLPTYGAGLRVKDLFSATKLAEIRSDVLDQVRREDEVQTASALVTSPSAGVLIVDLTIKATFGTFSIRLGRNVEQDQFFVV